MLSTYTILSTNGELLTSPYVNKLKHSYDFVLNCGEPKVVNFLLQFPISHLDIDKIEAVYDADQVEIADIFVERYIHQTLISTTITAKEVGSFHIAFAVPYKMKSMAKSRIKQAEYSL